MSLLPLLINDNWNSVRPSRIMDQQFGLGLDLDDLFSPVTVFRSPAGYYRPWRTLAAQGDAGSVVTTDKDKFQVNLDVQQFKPEEISVKVTDDKTITIEAKHEEKQDEHGLIYRHFIRRYTLPDGHDIKNVVSNLSSDGVLSITAPRVVQGEEAHRTIPIQQTGVPSNALKNKTENKEGKKKN